MILVNLAYLFAFSTVPVTAFPFGRLSESISRVIRTLPISEADGRLPVLKMTCRGPECHKPNDDFHVRSDDEDCNKHRHKGFLIDSSVARDNVPAMARNSEELGGLWHGILRVRRVGSRQDDIVLRDDTSSGDEDKPAKTTDSPASESTTSSATSDAPSSTPTQSPSVSTTTSAAVTVTVSPTSSSTNVPLETHLSAGSIAASAVFGLCVLAGLSFLLFICLRRRKRSYMAKKQRRESSQTQRLLAVGKPESLGNDSPAESFDSTTHPRDTNSMFSRSSSSSEVAQRAPSLYIPLQTVQRPRALSGGLYPLSPDSAISSSPVSPSAATLRQSSSDLSSKYNPASARRSASYQGQVGRARVVSVGAARAETFSTLTTPKAPSRGPSLVSQISIDTGVGVTHTRGSSVSSLHALP